jgi:hypothetical protein
MTPTYRFFAGLLLAGLLAAACETGSFWEGRYVGHPGQDPAGMVTLTLQTGGKGQWTADQESTPLRWEERGGAIWLHLKTGVVIVAQTIPAEKTLSLQLPGIGAFRLRKATP